ncbi:MAG: hypothetical protein WCD70_15130 [Alphaproteobacteria bacterium]
MKTFALIVLLILCRVLPAHATQYVNSVQHGSVTIASGSLTGTASITATVGTPFLVFQGCTTSAAASNGQAYARIALSGTTITATRGVSSTTTVNCTFDVVDATSNLVSSVQTGTISMTTGTGVTSMISAVTTANSSVFYEGMSQTLTSQHFDLNTYVVTLTNTTTVTGTLINGGSGTTIGGYQVVNWNPAALNSSTQQFVHTWTDSSGSTSTQAITSVTLANAMCIFEGGGSPNGDTTVEEQPTIQLTAPTTVTITIGDSADGNTQQDNFVVVEFVSGVLQQSAQRGTIALSAATNNTATITSSATTSSMLNWNGFRSSTATNTTHATIMPSETLTNATTVTANLNTAGSITDAYEVLNFQNTGGAATVFPSRPDAFTFNGFP